MWEIGEDVQALIDCLLELGIEWDGKTMKGGKLCKPSSKLDCKNKYTRKGPNIAEIKADNDDTRKITADNNQIMQVIIPKVKFIEITIPM